MIIGGTRNAEFWLEGWSSVDGSIEGSRPCPAKVMEEVGDLTTKSAAEAEEAIFRQALNSKYSSPAIKGFEFKSDRSMSFALELWTLKNGAYVKAE